MEIIAGFFTGSSIGYLAGNFFAGPQTGQSGLIGSILFNSGSWQFHLHHWLVSLLIFVFIFFFVRKKYRLPVLFLAFSFGFLSGLIFQGIFSYDDWHRILIRN